MTVSSLDILKYYARKRIYSQIEISNFKQAGRRADGSDIYDFDIRYQDGDSTRFKQFQLLHHQNSGNIEAEFKTLQELAAKRVPIPQPELYDSDTDVFDGEILIMERVDGKPLKMEIASYLVQEVKMKELISQFKMLLRMLQLLDFDQPPLSEILEKSSQNLDLDIDRITSTFENDQESIQQLVGWISEKASSVDLHAPQLIHGRLDLSNILLRNDELVLTNWFETRFDDPRREISRATIFNLLQTGYDTAIPVYHNLVDAMGYDQNSMDILTIIDGLLFLPNLSFVSEPDVEELLQENMYPVSALSEFKAFVTDVTGISPEFELSNVLLLD